MLAQEDMVKPAKEAVSPPWTNDLSKTMAGCGCCKVPEISYTDTLVCCYANPMGVKLADIISFFPEASAHIIEGMHNQGLPALKALHTSSSSSHMDLHANHLSPPLPCLHMTMTLSMMTASKTLSVKQVVNPHMRTSIT